MAQLLNSGVKLQPILVVMAAAIFLTGCSSLRLPAEIKTVTKIEKVTIPTVTLPKPVQLNDVRVYVVNAEIYEEFVKEFTEENGDLAFVALSMQDYENLALNISELRRYINQQKNIIIYYEKAVTEEIKQETE
jgi:ABC-type glycerol-3-phosphate transport system substrate-binding protein